MIRLLGRAQHGLLYVVAGLLCLSLFSPIIAMASTDLKAGEQAIVANPNGSGANLRRAIDSLDDSNIIIELPQDAKVTIGEGPIVNDLGTWFWITVQDETLAENTGYIDASLLTRVETTATTATAPDSAPATDQATQATEEAAAPAPVGLPWQNPIEFGFVVDNNNEIPADGLACRVDAALDAEVITRIPAAATLEVVGARVWVGEASFVQVNCGDVSGFVNGSYVVLQSEQAPEEVAPTEVVLPTEVPTEVVAQPAVPQGPAEVVTEAPTDVVIPTEVVEVPTEAVLPTEPVEQPAEALPTEAVQVPVEQQPAQLPVQDAPATGPTLGLSPEVTVEATAETSETAPATDVAAGETPLATQPTEATETEVVTEQATEVAPAEQTQQAAASAAVVTEAATETPPVAPAADLSKSIGSAIVTGTNGEGLRCRVAPSDDGATILVLEEGTKVSVLAEPVNGYLKIACAGVEGFGDVNYLWSGGNADDPLPQGAGASVVVTGTGNGLNCRTGAGTTYPVITVLPDGTVLQTRDGASNGWIAVVCGGQDGFVSSQYVANSGGTATPAPSQNVAGTTGTGTITGTGGDGVRCRSGAGTTYSTITVLSEGASVTVRGAAQGSWTPVSCGGQNGWVSSDYITVGGGSTPPAPAPSTGGGAPTGTVTVTGTGGGGLNCRTGAGTSYPVISVLAEGSSVATTGAASNGWQPVSCGGQNGFVSSQYVTGGGAPAPAPTPTTPPSDGGGSTATGSATVSGTNGDGVRCRSGASTGSSTITVLPEGASVATRGSASGGWVPVICGGQDGYVSADYLTIGGGSTPPTTTPPPSSAPSGMVNGDRAKTTADINLRYEASLGAGIAAVAPAGTVVLITGGASNGFYPVDWDGLRGFMSGDYLTKTSEELSKRGGSANPGTEQPPAGGATATGNAIADYALQYVGYPYVWGTAGPASFDCSGFTYWVMKQVLGVDIGRGTWTQISAGVPVSRDNLQPGDLVFHQNTYQPGLSHVGIYIGNNKMVNGLNEDAGVVISDISSDYWESRWYGARRLT